MTSNNDGSKIPSVLLFIASYPFTKKINAVGISNIPAAFRAYRQTKSQDLKHSAKLKLLAVAWFLFTSGTVFSALFGRYPRLIQAHAICCIILSVKESLDARMEEEERARLKAEQGPSITGRLRDFLFGSVDEGDAPDAASENKSKTQKAQKVLKKTKCVIKGKRDSATDDIVWGTFQVWFILLDETVGQALAYAWLLFLLTVLEETLCNPKLSKERRIKRCAWIAAAGLICQYLVGGSGILSHLLRLGRYALSFLPL